MQAHGAQSELAFAEVAPDRIHRAQHEDEPACQTDMCANAQRAAHGWL